MLDILMHMTQEKLAYTAVGAIMLILAAWLYLYDVKPSVRQAWHAFWYYLPRLPWVTFVLLMSLRFTGKRSQGRHFARG